MGDLAQRRAMEIPHVRMADCLAGVRAGVCCQERDLRKVCRRDGFVYVLASKYARNRHRRSEALESLLLSLLKNSYGVRLCNLMRSSLGSWECRHGQQVDSLLSRYQPFRLSFAFSHAQASQTLLESVLSLMTMSSIVFAHFPFGSTEYRMAATSTFSCEDKLCRRPFCL